jgi:hypothetical protein
MYIPYATLLNLSLSDKIKYSSLTEFVLRRYGEALTIKILALIESERTQ